MRTIDPALQAALDGGATTLCRCWRIRRRDGVALGFTDHDRTLDFDGTAFRASAGLVAAAIESSTGLSVDNSGAAGVLTDEAITEDDIRAGRYDGAEVDQWLVDWTAPSRRLHLFRGTLGEIRRKGRSFEAELRGPTEALNVPVGRTVTRTCDCTVGDARCGVDLDAPAFVLESEVAAGSAGARIVAAHPGPAERDWFAGGILHWLSGALAGLTAAVASDRAEGGGRRIDLAEGTPLPVAVGDRFRVTAGCDRRAETCRTKFDNFLNFRGFPHVPGEDWVVAYPKSGAAHDGSSLGRG